MSRLCSFLVALMLTATPSDVGKAIAKLQRGSVDSMREGVPILATPGLVQSATTASTPQLPNGASSISETYGNWIVGCRLGEGQKRCLLLQIQSNSQTNQPIFQIELQMTMDEKMEGGILMPLALKLDSGAVLMLDDRDLGRVLRFSTCIPAGCLLPVSFPAAAVDAMKRGKVLTVSSLKRTGEIITFNVSLDGFAAAVARITELGKWKPLNSSVIHGEDGD